MNMFAEIVIFGIFNTWTTVILLWLYSQLFEARHLRRPYLIGLGAIVTLVLTFVNLKAPSIEVNMIATLVIVEAAALFFAPRMQSLFIGFYFYFTHLLIEDIAVLVLNMTSFIPFETTAQNNGTQIALMFSVELIFSVCILLVRKNIKIIKEHNRLFSFWSLTLLLTSVLLLILHFTTISSVPYGKMSAAQLVNALALFCMIHVLIACFSSIMKYDFVKRENRELQRISNYYVDSIEKSMKLDMRTYHLKHEMKRILYAISVMARQGDLAGIADACQAYKEIDAPNQRKIANTGLYEIDNLVDYLVSRAGDGIEVSFNSSIKEALYISSKDCILLLGNLLENAIEATAKAEEKWIGVRISLERNIFLVEIENTFNGELRYDQNGNIQTTKENPDEHGFGIKSIRSIVEKYSGVFECAPIDQSRFLASALLYQKQELF